MSAPDRYIPGVPCWADTNQPDRAAAARFYSKLFGWQCENVMSADAESQYLVGRLSGGDVAAITGFPDDGSQKPALQQRGRSSSAAQLSSRRPTPPWVRMSVVQDPAGAVFGANLLVPENS
ncbi:VOC family protein [Hoyosella subflava]|uniref:Glyoxalase/bleomycin resistance protein/dioxygenase n=1 Tax=Hoyosella subflava (strain DSM 45089 / JCM 17490 / NBRC 109087 / DQS3-9A1) TaxID=443218 RepID=F6ER56_HOYSD|nr:glyoxalase/bleomycin resistance protein/dioxygenase [Hoyosella subflava]AEF40743.1 Glyoxalase/bleomycin resistance protein/dioxygenase [Hoyosella subflava DQS3-9A1]